MINVFPSIEALSVFAAEKICEIAVAAISKQGNFTIALAGGSTPKTLYQLLASDRYKRDIDWSKTFFFFGDERNVLPDAEESNFRMVSENLFEPLGISRKNIFRWQTELEKTEIIAADYENTIRNFFSLSENEFPHFDLILLGMGADGHTASLFPFTDALDETEKIAVANPVEKLETKRLTLTFPVINNAANAVFLVAGKDKAETLKNVLSDDFQPERFPAQKVKSANGNLFWLIDAAAAEFLK